MSKVNNLWVNEAWRSTDRLWWRCPFSDRQISLIYKYMSSQRNR